MIQTNKSHQLSLMAFAFYDFISLILLLMADYLQPLASFKLIPVNSKKTGMHVPCVNSCLLQINSFPTVISNEFKKICDGLVPPLIVNEVVSDQFLKI